MGAVIYQKWQCDGCGSRWDMEVDQRKGPQYPPGWLVLQGMGTAAELCGLPCAHKWLDHKFGSFLKVADVATG